MVFSNLENFYSLTGGQANQENTNARDDAPAVLQARPECHFAFAGRGAFGAGLGFFFGSLFSCHSPGSGSPEQFLVG